MVALMFLFGVIDKEKIGNLFCGALPPKFIAPARIASLAQRIVYARDAAVNLPR